MDPLKISEEDKDQVRKQLGLTEDDLKRDVEILKEWMKKQPHLPQGVQDDKFFENILIRNKGRVEKAKQRIDTYYTVKTIWPEIYENIHELRPSKHPTDVVALLQLNANKERVLFYRMRKNSSENFTTMKDIRLLVTQLEILSRYEYCSGIHMVMDMTDFPLDFLKVADPFLITKYLSVFSEVYSYPFRGVHIYHPPSWIELFLNMFKPLLRAKLYERIVHHHNMDALSKIIPKEALPKYLGGTEKSLEEMIDEWDKIIEDHQEYLEDVQKLKSNEKLRVGKCKFETEMFGVDGTFKKLNID